MSVAEMKLEAINKIINLTSEETLLDVLKLLQRADDKEPIRLSENYDAIKAQYGDVLQKLA
jgi:hypothetical protein